jgi:hypothetical protein
MRKLNDIDLVFETAEEDERKEEYDLLMVPLEEQSEQSHRFHDPLSRDNDNTQTEKQQQQHCGNCNNSAVVGFSFSLHFVATTVLLLLIASQGSLLYCCSISVTIRNKVFRQQQSRIQKDGRTFHKNSTIPILRKYSLNIPRVTIWSSTLDTASKIETIYSGDEIVVEEDMSNISRFEKQKLLHVIRPRLGFVEQRYRRKPIIRNNVTIYPLIMEPLSPQDQPHKGEYTTNSICPLFYSGWRKSSQSKSRTMYANPALVLAQQFWNGMQVFLLFLIIVVHFRISAVAAEYQTVDMAGKTTSTKGCPGRSTKIKTTFFTSWRVLPLWLLVGAMYLVNPEGYFMTMFVALLVFVVLIWARHGADHRRDEIIKTYLPGITPLACCRQQSELFHRGMVWWEHLASPTFQMWAVRGLGLVTVCLLPFACYVSSPGGHCFTVLTIVWIGLAFLSPKTILRLSLGDTKAMAVHASDNSDWSPPYTICFEETVGFFCTLGSSIYNFAGHSYVWPHWKQQFNHIDKYMGWPRSGDLTWEENWTIWGIFAEQGVLPPFVPRGDGGSTTGAQLFWIVWSVLPFLYCFYFACMILLSQKTPNVLSRWVQRLACLFGIMHFIFGTDVVHYRYGRGYRNPHSEVFHWTEKW